MAPVLAGCGILLVQLEVNFNALERAVDISREAGALVVFNCAPVRPFPQTLYGKIDVITPNETEARALTGVEIGSERDARRAADWFMDRGVEAVVITLGEHGVFAADREKGRLIPAVPVRAVDATGAGDGFYGNFAAGLADGMDLWEAATYANAAAALSVTRIGTALAMPSRQEVEALFQKELGRGMI
jgi:ribokinase